MLYNYTYSNMNNNIITRILVQILFSESIFIDKHFSSAFVGRISLLLYVKFDSDWVTTRVHEIDCNVLR